MQKHTMRHRTLWAVVLAGGFWGAVGAGPAPAYAQKSPAGILAISPADQDISIVDAQRGALDRFLDSHPEIANEVVGRPAVMSDPNFLHEHPELQAFLEGHALVKADPRAFLSPRAWRDEPRKSEDMAEFESYFFPCLVVVCFLLGVLWVLRTLLENRRWNRSFKMHEDVHTKLIEKFASGQDFSAYLQSEGGRRLLEWTPPALDNISQGLPNPISRILWSMQAGLVLFLVGLGLLQIRGHVGASEASALLVFGTLGVTLGAGFILSALVSFGLSKHLGLIGGAVQGSDVMVKH